LEFLFVGGGTNYVVNDATASRNTGIPFTDRGFVLTLDLTGTDTYKLSVGEQTISGTLKSHGSMEIRQFHVWNYSAGVGSNYDVFLADLFVWDAAPPCAVVTDTVEIVREAPVWCVWHVQSSWGNPEPPAGVYSNLLGSIITNSVEPWDTRGSTQYECTGWTLANHDPSSGASNQVVFVLTNDTVLTWQWATNFAVFVQASEHGAVTPTGGWYRAQSNLTLTAYPDLYYHFVQWTGDVPEGATVSNPVALVVDGPKSVSASFDADVTSAGTPHWWLASHGWTSDFETVEAEDTDGDGYTTRQEWIALTDPTNAADALVTRVAAFADDYYVVEWPGRSNRVYWIYVQTNATSDSAAVIGPINGPQSVFTDATYHVWSPVFYRVVVGR
jgi:hypothetical protein